MMEVEPQAELQEEPVRIEADIAGSFTYASFQNAIPVLRSITIHNPTAENLESCELRLDSNPPFLRQKVWTLDRILAGDSINLSDRRVDLDAAYLAGLNEAERGEITLTLSARGRVIAEECRSVRLLARDEWGGVADMAQLLPAFVMPNDPGIARLLRSAAERLVAHGHPSGLDGYQTGDPKRAFLLTGAIYSAAAGLGLHYAEPPASFEMRGQKVRRPSTISEQKLATCLDTSLLIAAGLEAAGLNAVVLLFTDHAAVGVWLNRRTLANAIETDPMEVRKALAARELLVFETTGITHRPPMTLAHASTAIRVRLDEDRAHEFVAAIDIARARSGGITPLASHERATAATSEGEGDDEPVELPLPQVPALGDMPAELIEEKPTTAAGRIDRWQKKLLDLTLRNRLLNFPDTKKTIPFLCPDISYLEDRLAAGAAIRLISLPEQNPVGERDAELFRQVRGEDLQRRFATDALQRDELASTLDTKGLEARLIDLHRQVKNDLAEGGANTLFLAVGFLRWKKKPQDEKTYRAPLLLVPAKLERKSASSRFSLRFHEDEPRFNATLLQFLERDFDLSLPQFSGDLPLDENGVDVPRLLAAMRNAVRDVPGMEVVDETALSTFSFAKFLMWKDLVERTDALRQNRVVKHLIDTPEQAFSGEGGAFIEERELDRSYAPADIVSLLPADSSQIAASLAAAEGRDFVIVGPPGTGKSQTIANMIANCLSAGKTVLFVAEKTAALDVVYRRLREHGLGDHCLELHSSKTDRRTFLGQLKRSWASTTRFDEREWVAVNEKLRLRRDHLNAYVDALHRRYGNGMTVYGALGTALKGRDDHAPTLEWPSCDAHDEAMLRGTDELADELGRVYRSVEHRPSFALIDMADWSSAWQERVIASATRLGDRVVALQESHEGLLRHLGLPPGTEPAIIDLARLGELSEAICSTAGSDHSFAFDREFSQLRRALAELEGAIGGYRDAEAGLAGSFARDRIAMIPVEQLEDDWRQASASIWPKSWLGRRRVKKLLQSYASGGTVDPQTDLDRIRRMQGHSAAVSASALASRRSGYAGLDTDTGSVREKLDRAKGVRESVMRLGRAADELRGVVQSITPALASAEADEPIRQAGQAFCDQLTALRTAAAEFSELSGTDPLAGQGLFSNLPDALRELSGARHLLRDWAAWCKVRQEAVSRGLGPLVADIESGAVQPDASVAAFRLGYARWWLPPTLDADPVLREFRRFQHEHAIEDFRHIDDLVRAAATGRVARAVAHGLPSVQSVPRNSELGLLRHQMDLQRPSRSIREMIAAMPGSFSRLAPCMLMSPLSIAQYLPPDQALFDVVIFDEASQITTWDAVGAIARATQTIIVGDPKQLPPTNFFGRNEEDEEVVEHEKDLESILDEARAAGIPVRDLRWHYRSRNESLIAFSNHHYYANRLITFPSPSVEDRAVRLHPVANGVYDRGKSRTNRIEAEAVASEAVARMRTWLSLEEGQRPTLGVITFNAQQQALIQDLLDAARRTEPELEWFFADERVEGTIVKNLENVQGDERDVILFSITFTADAAGKRTMDFGALNRDGGERRLNVAVTRARQELNVFSGFTADQIDTSRTKALGVHHLKTYLDFAERGAIALPAVDEGSVGALESPFEEAVAAELEKRGWQIVPQVGISGFRLDIGVRHPDLAGAYLAGVECDGATYHSSATARDRDKVREQVLRGLGWNIIRVWSTDWWFDAGGAAQRMDEELNRLLEESREKRSAENGPPADLHWDMGHEIEPLENVDEAPPLSEPEHEPPSGQMPVEEQVSAPVIPAAPPSVTPSDGLLAPDSYRVTDLSTFQVDPDRFYEVEYRSILQGMVDAVLACEAPLREDILAQRIARAHGWLRTGNRIRERIDLHLRDIDRTQETTGTFVWRKGEIVEILPYRGAGDEASRRSVVDIPLAELASVVVKHPTIFEAPDPALALARVLGVERLAATARQRLDEALARAQAHLATGN